MIQQRRVCVPWIERKVQNVLEEARCSHLPEKVNASRLHFLLYVCGALCLGEDGLRSFATELGIKYRRNKINGKYLLRLNLVKTAVLNVKLDISR
jgi:hypothetical protein